MAGMYGLGRVYNVIPIAASKAFSLRNASGVAFICTGSDTFTLNTASSYSGGTSTLAVITQYYTSTATDGTAAWVRNTQAAADSVAQTTGMTVFEVLTSQLSDPADYVKVTIGSGGLVTAVLYDLTVQRKPANLTILGV